MLTRLRLFHQRVEDRRARQQVARIPYLRFDLAAFGGELGIRLRNLHLRRACAFALWLPGIASFDECRHHRGGERDDDKNG